MAHPALLTSVAAALALMTGLGAYLAGGAAVDQTPPPRRPLLVRTFPAERVEHHTVERSYVGSIQPRRRSEVGFERAGELVELRVDDGDTVERHQTLALMDTAALEARRAELVARLREAEAQARLAQLIYERTGEAFAASAATQREMDEARQRRRAADAAVARVRRGIESIDVELDKSVLKAPFDALVAERRVDEGRVVDAGTPVLVLLDRTKPEARIGVPARVAADVRLGEDLEVRVNGDLYTATVHRLLPVTSRETRTVEMVLRLDAELDGLREGDLARLDLPRRIDQGGYWLPLSALTESARGLWACYVAEPVTDGGADSIGTAAHRVTPRPVEIVHTATDRALVVGALRSGERVVADGLHRIVAGQRVRLASRERAPSEMEPDHRVHGAVP